ncbi:MAG: hypothetical protein AAFZ17_20555 [Cyanobacteria bacterium J06650_10]
MDSEQQNASQQQHEVERVYVSNRGLHVCFKTEAGAQAAYQSALSVGRASILEGTQVIEPQIQSDRTASEA